MGIRSLLFTGDKQTSALISQVLAGLDVEGEFCSEGPAGVEKVIQQSFQIVIIDWDMQPEAGLLLTTARERKATERPLTLAIVSDDVSVPKALQAGANSILRKPLLINQVQETLKTARDLLRARESAAAQAAAASASSATRPAYVEQAGESHLRAGEFLQSTAPPPGAQFVVESEAQKVVQQRESESLTPLRELEPTAAAVQSDPDAAPAEPDEPRGLAYYLNRRPGPLPLVPTAAAAAPAPAPATPDLIGYDQMPTHPQASHEEPAWASEPASAAPPNTASAPQRPGTDEQQTEAKLFAYITDGDEGAEEEAGSPSRLGRKAIVAALVLAACAIVAAPQAPWHPRARALWARGQQTVRGWLNPQPVTTSPAPVAHEDFARPGDEYKLPVAESIPDATTDPSQIRVTPVVDPTKKSSNPDANGEQPVGQGEGEATSPGEQAQPPAVQVQENPPAQAESATAPPAIGPAAGETASPASMAAAHAADHLRSDAAAAASSPSAPLVAPGLAQPAPPVPLPHTVSNPKPTAGIPSSLKSQMASTTPYGSGNKPVEAALPSIEPVEIPEATARGLLTDQPAIPYPANAKGQQGTVVLQVLIGRDGTVQDAKFLQGSLAFVRTAIGGVKQWKFKPYVMNGRAVSVQTNLTISFKPGS